MIATLPAELASNPQPADVLRWAYGNFSRVAIVASFQAESSVIIDIASRIRSDLSVLTLDTGRLPQETYDMMDSVRLRYGVSIEVILPDPNEVERMVARLKIQEITPTIVGLQEQLERIRVGEMERMRRKYGPLTAEQEEAWDALTRAIINKIAHGPISELRNHAGRPEGAPVIDAIRKAFHLQD